MYIFDQELRWCDALSCCDICIMVQIVSLEGFHTFLIQNTKCVKNVSSQHQSAITKYFFHDIQFKKSKPPIWYQFGVGLFASYFQNIKYISPDRFHLITQLFPGSLALGADIYSLYIYGSVVIRHVKKFLSIQDLY